MLVADHGILLINKPGGMSSHDVVDAVRNITGVRRVGHAGTLDPAAEGLLIVLVGRRATREQSHFMQQEKEYVATIYLGAESTTDDSEGDITQTFPKDAKPPTEEKIQKTLAQFTGTITQTPPAYSAVKVKGKRAYTLARKGKQPKLKPRKVHISALELERYAFPELTLRIACSKGTYIRSLARDLGQALGTGAYLASLKRTRIGSFRLEDGINLNDLTSKNWQHHLLPIPDEDDTP